MIKEKYGAVYTPHSLSMFLAELLKYIGSKNKSEVNVVLDPASGEGSLLNAARFVFGENCRYFGIDIDLDAVNNTKKEFQIIHNDAIMPRNVRKNAMEYWRSKLPKIDLIVANPPWSSQKIYDRCDLINNGYTLISGQYDSYVLFMEFAYNLLREKGLMAFIIPDSLFSAQNENLRKFLTKNTQIQVIARLGEKIFNEVNRAATIIICKKELPTMSSDTICFRLSTADRKKYLNGEGSLLSYFTRGCHVVKQQRFLENIGCKFDIDTYSSEEQLIKKIKSHTIEWSKVFNFGRGAELSKAGKIVYCPHCMAAQGYKKQHLSEGRKKCVYCGEEIVVNGMTTDNLISKKPGSDNFPILVGEDVRRYEIAGKHYIKSNIPGINYKNQKLYTSPKLLIRKTGLGIYCAIDYTGSMTSQTVYILKYTNEANATPLEYYLAFINSRVVYYYYLKIYGENEWKSHPYLTKKIIFDLPIKPYTGSDADKEIIRLATKLMRKYDYRTDIELEKLIMKKYKLNKEEQKLVSNEMHKLPDLNAVKNMKMGE